MISVIVPTFNRSQLLNEMLRSFFMQKNLDTIPFELIVVDNASSDQTKQVVESISQIAPGKVKYHYEIKKGVSCARNAGIRLSSGDIVAFLDDDIEIDENWMTAVDDFFKTIGADAMGGRIVPGYPIDIPEWVRKNSFCLEGPIVAHDYGKDIKPYEPENMFVMVGANMAFRRAVLDEVGYFNEHLLTASRMPLAEDTELALRLFKFHKKSMYCGKAKITHPVLKDRTTLKYITKWYYNHGKFYVYMDDHGVLTGNYKRINGVPRYLYRQLLVHMMGVISSIFIPKNFFPHLNEVNRIRGAIDELALRHRQKGKNGQS